jgi:LCP family protein required for cell wall assembly
MPTDDDSAPGWSSPSADDPGGRPSRGLGRKHNTSTLIVRSLAILLAVIVTAGSLGIYLKYRAAWDGIARVDVSGDLPAKNRPPVDPHAENILLIGSDSRVGVNGQIGGTGGADVIDGARSDTIIVVHIAPEAHEVVVLSIPRDSVVPILNCTPEGGTPGQTAAPLYDIEQINATYAYGGPGCLWETIEQTTGIHINNFIELTFSGFEQVINDLGGVNVCLPAAVDDPASNLNLSAGVHHVYGPEALAFWRTRENLGTGSDPQRIQRDQFLMASLFQGLEHSSLLKSPTTILSVIDTLTSHQDVVTDSGLTPVGMLRIAEDLRGIKGDSVQFVTAPWTTYTGNAQWINSSEEPSGGNVNWVQWVQPEANTLFSDIAHDTALPKATKATAPPTVSPADVQVQVLNGTTTYGLATSTSESLTEAGFDVVGAPTDAAADTYSSSIIEYKDTAELAEAQTLAKAVSGSTLQEDPSLTGSALQLILGSTFSGLSSTSSGSSGSSSAALANAATTYGGITGSVNICDDSSAFAGPDGS